MAELRGLGVAFGLFAASFALHIVAGASGQRWLFALAVALIYALAAGFPAVAAWLAGRANAAVLIPGSVAGAVFTTGALWATNGRAFAWWEVPLAAALVIAAAAAAWAASPARRTPRWPRTLPGNPG